MAAKPSEAKTTIDSLTELLRSKGKMDINKIALTLGTDVSIVEGWVKVLEDANLVKVTYDVGKMYVEPISSTREELSAMATTREEEKSKLENAINMQKVALDKYLSELGEIETQVKAAQRAFQQKFPDLERQLEAINKIYSALQDESAKIDAISKKAESVYKDINAKISSLYDRVEGADVSSVEKARAEVQKMQDTITKSKELEGQLDLLSKSKDTALAAIRKGIEDQLKSLENELKVAESNIDEQLQAHRTELQESIKSVKKQAQSINDLAKDVNNFRHDKEGVKRALNDAKRNFNDEYSKLSAKMTGTGGVLREQVASMLDELGKVKEGFGQASAAYEMTMDLNKEVQDVSATIASLRSEANKLTETVRSATSSKASADVKDKALVEAQVKIKLLTGKVQKLEDRIEVLSKKAKPKK